MRTLALLGLLVLVQGCAGDDVVSGAVQSAPDVGAVTTLVLGVHVRIDGAAGSALEPYDGFALAGSQVKSVRLRVDDESWGTFTPVESTLPANTIDVDGWSVIDAADSATVIATVGSVASADEAAPVTVQDWVRVLDRRLMAGGHLVEVEEITLTNANNETLTLTPRVLVPIRVEAGDRSAVIELNFTTSDLGGAS